MRRTRARRLGLVSLVVALGLLGAACGDDDGGDDVGSDTTAAAGGPTTSGATTSTAVSTAEDVDPAGVVRWAADLSGAATGRVHFDPAASTVASADTEEQWLVYDSLLRATPDGRWEPGLATSAEILDPQTIEVELRPDVVFSDGTAFDAEAVKFGIERNLAVPVPRRQFRAELGDLDSVEIVDPMTVRLHLNKPTAGAFYPLLGGQETFIVSPTAARSGANLDDAPVGAGPFLMREFLPERHIVYERDPDYWDADNVRLGGIEFVHVTAGPQRLNALRGGEVDISVLTITELPSVQGSELEVDTRTVENQFLWLPVCKSRPPLDDVRVRQALNFAINRDAINDALLHGEGEPMWMLWAQGTPYYVDELEGQYAYDPDRARQLLAEAGHADGLSVTVLAFPGSPLQQQAAEVLQAQWADVGVTVEIVQSANAVQEFYVETRYDMAVLSSQRGGILKLSGPFRPGSIGNVCQYDNPELNTIIDRIAAVPDGSPEAVEAWADAQRLVVDEALSIWGNFIPAVHAWDPEKLGGVDFVLQSGAVGLTPVFTEMYVKA